MVMKIFNWLGSGIFRTIGRVIAYVIIGLILGLIAIKSNVKISDIFDFNFVVHASDKGYASSSYHAVFTDINDENFTDVSWSNMGTGISAPSNAKILRNTYIRIIGSSSYVYKVNNSYTLTYTFSYNPKHRNYIDKLYCGKDVMFSLYGGTSNTSSGIDTANIQSFSVSCEDLPFQDYGVKYTVRFTPTVNLQYILIRSQYNNWFIYYDYRDFSGYPYRMNAINYGGLKIDEQEGTNSVIEKQTQTIINQTNQLNNSINNINGTLNDTDVNTDTNDMGDFLNDMSFDKDNSVSSILTIPIDFLQSVFDGDFTNTQDLCFTLKGVQSCLPSGSFLWNRTGCHDNAPFGCASTLLNAFRTFFNLVVGGFICYKLLLGIVRTYDKALDPLDNGMEMMKL